MSTGFTTCASTPAERLRSFVKRSNRPPSQGSRDRFTLVLPLTQQLALQAVIGPAAEHFAVLGKTIHLPGLCPERRGHHLRREDRATTEQIDDIAFRPMPPHGELRAREQPRLILLGIVRDGLVVVQVLAAHEKDAAVVELEEVVEAFVFELLHAEGARGAKRGRRQQALLLEFPDTLLGGLFVRTSETPER